MSGRLVAAAFTLLLVLAIASGSVAHRGTAPSVRADTAARSVWGAALPARHVPESQLRRPIGGQWPTELDSLGGAGSTRRSLIVDGESDAVRVPGHADLSPRGALTIELWFKHHLPAGCGTLVGKDRQSSYWLGLCDGRLRFYVSGGSYADGVRVVPEGRWTHVAVSYDGVERVFYVNGERDQRTTVNSTPLFANGVDLAIGADATPGAPFQGRIDHVRLWSTVRTEQQIRDARFERLRSGPGLVAEWTLDGTARDLVGRHDGRIASGGAFSFDGALPRDVTIPLGAGPVTVDGRCTPAEYGSSERVVTDSSEAPVVFIHADSADLWYCFKDLPRPRSQNALAVVYMDRDLGRSDLAQPNDYRFSINTRGALESKEGDGLGGYRNLDLPPGSWQGAMVAEAELWSAEMRLPRRYIDRPADPDDPLAFGLAVAHALEARPDEQAMWPIGAVGTRPATWSVATLADSAGLPPVATFTGVVRQHGARPAMTALPGATVQLFLAGQDGVLLADTTTSDGGGRYDLRYRGYPPEEFLVREIDPRGTTSVSADAGADGVAAGPNLLKYEVAIAGGNNERAYSEGLFVDAVGVAAPQVLDQHYLIAYGDPVTESDLWPIVQAKQRQGFQVVTRSIQDLERTGTGRDLAAKIHNWLKAYWQAVEPQPVYALLVGRGDRVPVRDIGWLDNDHRDPSQPDYYPAWPTDWYYADLDSDWDADGDGYFGEFLRCRPGDTYADPEDGDRDCPELGSLAREGPFGALRTAGDDFEPEISIGRIAINEPGNVRRALEAAAAAESSGSPDKRRALIAGSFYSFEGRSWDREGNAYVSGGHPRADASVQSPWDGRQPFGQDSAEYLEGTLRPAIEPFMTQVTRLYESTIPQAGLEFLVPTRQQPDAPLTPGGMAAQWQGGRFGLVNAAGLGWSGGLLGGRWQHDWDGNLRIDNPANPAACAGSPVTPLAQIGPPCWEVIAEPFLHGDMPASTGLPPVVVANSGGTGAVGWSIDGFDSEGNVLGLRYGSHAIAGALPGRGQVAAWVGTLTDVAPGSLDAFQAAVNNYVLDQPLRLGDAVWQASSQLARGEPHDMRSYAPQLFGDPAHAYWGNTADSAGPWPQDGRDWRATGTTPYSGPAFGETAWSSRDLNPNSPVSVGRNGEVYVAGISGVVRYTASGAVSRQVRLGSGPGTANRYAPAIASDGVYVASGSTLFVLDLELNLRQQVALPGGATVTGAVRLAPDGVVWVPTTRGLARITGAGNVLLVGNDEARGPMAMLPSGEVIWATDSGAIAAFLMDRAGNVTIDEIAAGNMGSITPPAVSAVGTVYVGSSNGRLYGLPRDSQAWQVDTGGAVRARPVVANDGRVFVANARGTIVAYAPESSTELWRIELATPIDAAPTCDGSQLYVAAGPWLYALNLANGEPLWRLPLGGLVDVRGTPVIGADRTLYVLLADGTLTAVRESGWLAAPSGVSVMAGPDRATIQWRDNSDEEVGFRVEICEPNGKCFDAGTTGPDDTTFLARRLPVASGEPFFARVQALGRQMASAESGDSRPQPQRVEKAAASDTNLASDFATSDLAAAGPSIPTAPHDAQARAITVDAIRVSWQYSADPGQLVGFEVQRALARTGPFTVAGFVEPDARLLTDVGLAARTPYYYRVVAINAAGQSEAVEANATTKSLGLRAPTELRIAVGEASLALTWRDSAQKKSGFVVERRAPGSAVFEVIGRLGPHATSFVDSAYLANGRYHYRVKAVADDDESPYAQAGARFGGVKAEQVYVPWAWR